MSNSLFSQHTRLSEEVFQRFMSLPETESYQAEYICESPRPRPLCLPGVYPEQLPRAPEAPCHVRRTTLDTPRDGSTHTPARTQGSAAPARTSAARRAR